MRLRIAVLPLAVVALTLPVKYSPTDGVTLARACGQEVPTTGTCCPQLRATCVIGSYVGARQYYLREGPCP